MTIVVAIVVGAVAFFGGMKYQESKSTAQDNGQFVRNGANRGGGRFGNGGNRPITGEIISNDDKSITVKLMDGSSKIVLLSDKTQINKAEKVLKNDLKTGEQVAVFGTQNSDGSVTAINVQLNPQFGAMRDRLPTPTQ